MGCDGAVETPSLVLILTSIGKDAIVSDITRTAPKTADRRMLLSSVIAKPVLEAAPSNIQEAGLAKDVEGLLGDERNAPNKRLNRF